MGDLIVMTRPTEASRRPLPLGACADILFFTGVRYYRTEETVAAPAAPLGRRRSQKGRKSAELQRAAITL